MAKTTSAEWAKRVERWQDGGLSVKEFAAELSVNAGTLAYWKYMPRRESAPDERAESPGIRKAESSPFQIPYFHHKWTRRPPELRAR